MILSTDQQQTLADLLDYEVDNFPIPNFPKHQSCSNMHLKYADREELRRVLEEVLLQAQAIFNQKLSISLCWFNVIRSDSPYEIIYHKHNEGRRCDAVCVYYLKNCTGNGTFVYLNGQEKQICCLDNTLQFMSGDVMHSIALFKGLDRYSIALDLTKE